MFELEVGSEWEETDQPIPLLASFKTLCHPPPSTRLHGRMVKATKGKPLSFLSTRFNSRCPSFLQASS
jgi:hypothetical protein